MEELNLSSNWLDYVSAPGLSLFLFAAVLTVLIELKQWRSFLGILLPLLVALVVTVFLNLGGVYSITEQQSAILSTTLVFSVSVLALVLKGKTGRLWLVFTLAIGAVYGLNRALLKKSFFEQVSLWQDAPLLVVKVMAGFIVSYLLLHVLTWLVKTAFSIADRDRRLVVCGGVMGATAVLVYQLASSF